MNWMQRIVTRIGMDKIAHLFGSAFLTRALGHFIHWAIASCIVLALGVAKELWDGTFDKRDLLADAIGVVIGAIIAII